MADMPIAPGIIDRSGIAASGLRAMLSGYAARLRDRSKSLISFFDLQMETLILGWIGTTLAIAFFKIA